MSRAVAFAGVLAGLLIGGSLGAIVARADIICTSNPCSGNANDNQIQGRDNAHDEIFAKPGADVAFGHGIGDYIQGDDGSDVQIPGEVFWGLEGQNGDDTIKGNNGNDWLYGGFNADSLYGNDGNDNLLGQDGGDFLNGGPGTDWCAAGGQGGDSQINCE